MICYDTLLQEILEILWTVYLEEKLQSCLKGLRFAPVVGLAKLKFTYTVVKKPKLGLGMMKSLKYHEKSSNPKFFENSFNKNKSACL